MNKIHFSAIILLMLFSCTHTQKTAGTERPFEIHFGHTGGFTNITVEFVVMENREVFRVQDGEVVRINKLRSKEMKEIRNMIDSIDFKNLVSEEPGNLNYYINLQSPEYKNSVQWSDPVKETPLNSLYRKLLTTIN
jgi:carbonic anhydrase